MAPFRALPKRFGLPIRSVGVYKGGMDEKQKGPLVYFCGWVAYGLMCLALTAAICVASIIPIEAFYAPLLLFVAWNAYLTGIVVETRRPFWRRVLLIFGTGLAAYDLILLCWNLVVPLSK